MRARVRMRVRVRVMLRVRVRVRVMVMVEFRRVLESYDLEFVPHTTHCQAT